MAMSASDFCIAAAALGYDFLLIGLLFGLLLLFGGYLALIVGHLVPDLPPGVGALLCGLKLLRPEGKVMRGRPGVQVRLRVLYPAGLFSPLGHQVLSAASCACG